MSRGWKEEEEEEDGDDDDDEGEECNVGEEEEEEEEVEDDDDEVSGDVSTGICVDVECGERRDVGDIDDDDDDCCIRLLDVFPDVTFEMFCDPICCKGEFSLLVPLSFLLSLSLSLSLTADSLAALLAFICSSTLCRNASIVFARRSDSSKKAWLGGSVEEAGVEGVVCVWVCGGGREVDGVEEEEEVIEGGR